MASPTGFGRRSSPAARCSGSNPVGDAGPPLARGQPTARLGRRYSPAARRSGSNPVGDASAGREGSHSETRSALLACGFGALDRIPLGTHPLARGQPTARLGRRYSPAARRSGSNPLGTPSRQEARAATARLGRRYSPAALALWIESRWGRLSAGANTVGDAIAPGLAALSSSSARSLPEVAAQDAPHREILVEPWPVEAEGREFDPFEFRLRHAFETRIPDYGKRQLEAAGQYHANLPVSMGGGNRAIAVRSGGHAAAPTQFHQALSEYARTSNSKVQVDRCCRTRWR